MGVLNITPDSFSDGGQLWADGVLQADVLLYRAEAMVSAGATLLDIGGESTRPGALPVSEAEELERVVGALACLRDRVDAVLSVDTSSPGVIRESAKAGAHLINDVRALTREGALEAASATGLPLCLMHMQGRPDTMQDAPVYQDVVAEVSAFLCDRVDACQHAGIATDRLLVDPGFGFGKTLQHNYALLARLPAIVALGYPVLVGMSRKSMIGQLTDAPPAARLGGSVALATLAVERGASIVRVHDVYETAQALAVWRALAAAEG
jgi:dihydropteroate synthase